MYSFYTPNQHFQSRPVSYPISPSTHTQDMHLDQQQYGNVSVKMRLCRDVIWSVLWCWHQIIKPYKVEKDVMLLDSLRHHLHCQRHIKSWMILRMREWRGVNDHGIWICCVTKCSFKWANILQVVHNLKIGENSLCWQTNLMNSLIKHS